MKTMRLSVAFAAMFSLAASADWKSDTLRWSDLLYPEASGWTPLYAMKKANLADFSRASLSASYMKFGKNAENEASCDNFQRLMEKQNDFYLFDMNGDGQEDLLYSGNCLCAEGHCTWLWLKKEGKWHFTEVARPHTLLVRAKADAKLSYSGLEAGCCDSVHDHYPLFGSDYRSSTLYKKTALPHESWKLQHAFQSKDALTLRSSPAVNDGYDLAESQHQNMAVWGNVLAKFLPGAKGKVLGETKGKDGKVWLLLKMGDEANVLRAYDYARQSFAVGWAPAASIQLSK